MIFATVGTQKPFPRLVEMVTTWARDHPDTPVVLQSGDDGVTGPDNLTCRHHLARDAFDDHVRAAEVIVAHAGMGTVLAARDAGRPLVIVPRRADWGEHRNDHQVDSAQALNDLPGIWLAEDETTLAQAIADARATAVARVAGSRPEFERLVEAVAGFIRTGALR